MVDEIKWAIDHDQLHRAAAALRCHDMKNRITRMWGDLPKYDQKKWIIKARLVFEEAGLSVVSE